MSKNEANHSESRREDWGTPQDLFGPLDFVFNFSADLAADKANSKCGPFYIDEDMDLMGPGGQSFVENYTEESSYLWLNPPYKSHGGTGKYVGRAVEIAGPRGLVILIPVSAGSRWWQRHVWPHFDAFVWPRRFPFEGAGDNAKFDCAICVRWACTERSYHRDKLEELIGLGIGPVTTRVK